MQTTVLGGGKLTILCNKEISKEITGHGIGGDDNLVWDKRFPEMVKEAQEAFDKLVAKGYVAMLPGGAPVRKFDPDAEEIVMVCPAVGG
jgi:hypothetical protein